MLQALLESRPSATIVRMHSSKPTYRSLVPVLWRYRYCPIDVLFLCHVCLAPVLRVSSSCTIANKIR